VFRRRTPVEKRTDATRLNDGASAINLRSAIQGICPAMAQTKPRPWQLHRGGAKVGGVIRASCGGTLGASLYLRLSIDSETPKNFGPFTRGYLRAMRRGTYCADQVRTRHERALMILRR
jgi:hypothetical protein